MNPYDADPATLAATLAITPAHPRRWLRLGWLLDAPRRRLLRDAHLVYDGHQVLHADGTPPAPGAFPGLGSVPHAHLPQLGALPGLVEFHSHIFLAGAELNVERRLAQQRQDAATLLASARERCLALGHLGIVAMRDGGDKDGVGLALARERDHRAAGAAAVYSPGAGIYREGRYGSFFGRPVEEFPDLAACVAERVAAGADHLKIVPTGIINFAKGTVTAAPQFSVAELRACKAAAQAHGRHLMAHASGDLGIGRAIAGGVDTLEHGFFITPEQLARMRDSNCAWVPTFAPVQVQLDEADTMGWDDGVRTHLRRILDDHAVRLRQALALGVTVLVGSDAGSCGVAHGAGLWHELRLLEAAGMDGVAALSRACHDNAQWLPGQPPLGRLTPGALAHFSLCEGDPARGLAHLPPPCWVIAGGHAHPTSPGASVAL